jgi:hypothetical protein
MSLSVVVGVLLVRHPQLFGAHELLLRYWKSVKDFIRKRLHVFHPVALLQSQSSMFRDQINVLLTALITHRKVPSTYFSPSVLFMRHLVWQWASRLSG